MQTRMQTMLSRHPRARARRALPSLLATLVLAAGSLACSSGDGWTYGRRGERAESDSMGRDVEVVRTIQSHARKAVQEGSAIVASTRQAGIYFLVNDSGHDETVFALDSAGNDRGSWRVEQARNVDWESLSSGPCAAGELAAQGASPAGTRDAVAADSACLYVGDTGDNSRSRAVRTIYRIPEPRALAGTADAAITATRLDYRYPDGNHDVEAMYVAPDGTTFLITKRPLRSAGGRLRPALVFSLPATAWARRDTVVATLRDSLPIVPGSAPLRTITDAALSPDARLLAVRTYRQVYTFATDSLTGLVRHDEPPAVCNVAPLGEATGEGITWMPGSAFLLLTSEGRRTPLHVVRCPLPGSP